MGKLTKQERNKSYRDALELITKDATFICYAIELVSDGNINCNENQFRELFMFKPDFTHPVGGWLNTSTTGCYEIHDDNNILIRCLILEFCIEMTN